MVYFMMAEPFHFTAKSLPRKRNISIFIVYYTPPLVLNFLIHISSFIFYSLGFSMDGLMSTMNDEMVTILITGTPQK